MSATVLFQCGERLCALRRQSVRRIAPMPLLTRGPSAPANLMGFMNLEGRAVPVVNAADLFAIEERADIDPIYRHILVVAIGDEALGLTVSRVTDIRDVDLSALRAVDASASLNGCVEGVISTDEGEAHLLNAENILLEAERAAIVALRLAEQKRLDEWATP